MAKEVFIYNAEFLSIGATAAATVNIPIQGDSDFELVALTGTVKVLNTDDVALAQPAMTVQIQNTGSGRILMDRQVDFSNIIGTGQRPFILPVFYTFPAGGSAQVSLTNLAAAPRFVRISLVGYKLFGDQPGGVAAFVRMVPVANQMR